MKDYRKLSLELSQRLRLTRPLVFLDTETTGLDTGSARILELFMLKVYPDGKFDTFYSLFKPDIEIPKEASDIHGLTDVFLEDEPSFSDRVDDIVSFLNDVDISGFNVKYDRAILNNELLKNNAPILDFTQKNIDPLVIYQRKERRTLSLTYTFYTGDKLEEAHSAEVDTMAVATILNAQLIKYGDLPKTVDELHLFSNYDIDVLDEKKLFIRNKKDGKIYFNFGKNKGLPAKDDKKYLNWMLTESYPIDTLAIVRGLLDDKIK